MKTEIVLVTPAVAAEMLKFNTKNRKVRTDHVRRIAEDMKKGRWIDNGDTIAFDENGNLIDGQHRLNAVIMSGITVRMIVVRDLKEQAFAFKDTNCIVRRPADVLDLIGETNTRGLAAALIVIYQYTSGSLVRDIKKPVSNDKILDLLVEYPEARESVARIKALHKHAGIIAPGLAAGLHYLFGRVNKEDADKFFDDLFLGANLEPGDPVFALRQRLVENRLSLRKAKLSRGYTAGICIKAWNHRRTGRSIRFLRVLDGERNIEIRGLDIAMQEEAA